MPIGRRCHEHRTARGGASSSRHSSNAITMSLPSRCWIAIDSSGGVSTADARIHAALVCGPDQVRPKLRLGHDEQARHIQEDE